MGLYRIDHVDDAQGHTGGGDELDVKGHGPGQGDPGRAAHPGQIHDAQEIGNDIACQYANEDGGQLGDALGEVVEEDRPQPG